MKPCAYCGRENLEDATHCSECGTADFVADPSLKERFDLRPTGEPGLGRGKSFFRWIPASIVLHVLSIGYAFFSFLDLYLAKRVVQRGLASSETSWYWGAFWNALVAVLCFAAWKLMKSRISLQLLCGSLLVGACLCLVMRTWIVGLSRGENPFPMIEAFLTWLPLLYVIVYGVRESKAVQKERANAPISE
jgi:hypothetical protein